MFSIDETATLPTIIADQIPAEKIHFHSRCRANLSNVHIESIQEISSILKSSLYFLTYLNSIRWLIIFWKKYSKMRKTFSLRLHLK